MSGGSVIRSARGLVLGLTLWACNTFDPAGDDGSAIPPSVAGPSPVAGFFGTAGAGGVPGFNPAHPTPILKVVRRAPEPSALEVDPRATIEVTFSLPIVTQGNAVTLEDSDGLVMPCIETVDGITLRCRPIQQLELGTTYRIELTAPIQPSDPLATVHIPASDQSWTFTTRAPGETIDLGAEMTRVVYDASAHRMFGIAPAQQVLGAVDFATRERTPAHPLPGVPDDLCVTPNGTRVFVVYLANALVTEHDAVTLEQRREVAWPAMRDASLEDIHGHVRCTETQLLLVDGQWEPSLWTLALDGGAPVDHSAVVRGVGDLVPTSDGEEFYYWRQVGWIPEAELRSDVRRVSLVDLTELDVTELAATPIGGPSLARDPIDAPIFLDEARDRVITHNLVFDSLDLAGFSYAFENGEIIYAVDPTRQRAASKRKVWSLETFEPIADALSTRSVQQFFDRDGALYFVRKTSLIVQRF